MSAKERLKGRMTKDSVTLLPCFYFVEVSESSSLHIDRDVSCVLCLTNRRELRVWWSSFSRWSRSKSKQSSGLEPQSVFILHDCSLTLHRHMQIWSWEGQNALHLLCHVNVKGKPANNCLLAFAHQVWLASRCQPFKNTIFLIVRSSIHWYRQHGLSKVLLQSQGKRESSILLIKQNWKPSENKSW